MEYLSGFDNHHASEARMGALPTGQNSPQTVPFGLVAEKLSGTAFTVARADNARAWLYRLRPSVTHLGFSPLPLHGWQSAPDGGEAASPDPLRWSPFAVNSEVTTDFLEGITTLAICGDVHTQVGAAVHIYQVTRSMSRRYFYNSDGEMLIVPESGMLCLRTEFGDLELAPGSIAVIPRGVRFSVMMLDGPARGYVCENYGTRFGLPERGVIGSDGLANTRDFEYPVACYEDKPESAELVCKLGGRFYAASVNHSPLDVVAWHGNLAPYRYDLGLFNAIGTATFDHPDPSINTVLTSTSDTPGVANVDFVIFPPRWLVAAETFRPPWYHRNVMSEFMGLIHGEYDGKAGGGFEPGGASLHNCMVPHGPDKITYDNAINAELEPRYLADTLAFMFESRYVFRPTPAALQAPELQKDYVSQWVGIGESLT